MRRTRVAFDELHAAQERVRQLQPNWAEGRIQSEHAVFEALRAEAAANARLLAVFCERGGEEQGGPTPTRAGPLGTQVPARPYPPGRGCLTRVSARVYFGGQIRSTSIAGDGARPAPQQEESR